MWDNHFFFLFIKHQWKHFFAGRQLPKIQFDKYFPIFLYSQMFYKIGVFINFGKFTGKHLCWSLFLINYESVSYNFIEKTLQYRCFLIYLSRYLGYFLYRKPPFNSFRSSGKYLTNKIVKRALNKGARSKRNGNCW